MVPERFKAIRQLTHVDNYWLRNYLEVEPDTLWGYSQGQNTIPKVVAERMYALYSSFQNAALKTCDILSKCTPTKLITFENSKALYEFEDTYGVDNLAHIVSAPISGSLYRGLVYTIDFLMSAIHERPIEIVQWNTHLPGEIQILSTTDDSVNVVQLV